MPNKGKLHISGHSKKWKIPPIVKRKKGEQPTVSGKQ